MSRKGNRRGREQRRDWPKFAQQPSSRAGAWIQLPSLAPSPRLCPPASFIHPWVTTAQSGEGGLPQRNTTLPKRSHDGGDTLQERLFWVFPCSRSPGSYLRFSTETQSFFSGPICRWASTLSRKKAGFSLHKKREANWWLILFWNGSN